MNAQDDDEFRGMANEAMLRASSRKLDKIFDQFFDSGDSGTLWMEVGIHRQALELAISTAPKSKGTP